MATSTLADVELGVFREMLRQDRLIKIYVGNCDTPYLIQESALSTTSDFFGRALKHEDHFSGENGTLKFPEDDMHAWEVFLYWRINNILPNFGNLVTCDTPALVRCWCFGEKYGAKEFQDLIMLELIKVLEDNLVDVDAVKIAFENTPDGSPLRRLMARETVFRLYTSLGISVDSLDLFDGVPGVTKELFKAQMVKDKAGGKGIDGLRTRIKKKEDWEQYMVGGGPKQHWAFRDAGK